MVLWVPELSRVVDPTVYQVNRPSNPTQITRALIFQPSVGLNSLHLVGAQKDGAVVQYSWIPDAGLLSWPDQELRGQVEESCEAMRTILRRAVNGALHERKNGAKEWMETATYPPLVSALRAKGLVSL